MGCRLKRTVFIGWDDREADACLVAERSIRKHLSADLDIRFLKRTDLENYTRPTERRDGRLWDVISEAPMATEHACARFFVKDLTEGWALFMDGDMLIREDLHKLFDQLDPSKALYCVKHRHEPTRTVKMDGQVQSRYPRKNWSSVMAINCDHPANDALTPLLNTAPGRDLHRFCWLPDDLIGEMDPRWNWLVTEPFIAHFTEGVPDMPGYENQPYADEWRGYL